MMENIIPNRYQVNLTKDTLAILATIEQLEGKYGMNYLISILRGQDQFGLKNDSHASLSTYGSLSELNYEQVRNRMLYLENQGYIKVKDARYGTLINDEKGVRFIEMPEELWVKKRALNTSSEEKIIRQELRTVRKELAIKASKPAFRIFTDYTLSLLVKERPSTSTALLAVPGFGDYKTREYGTSIFEAFERAQTKWEETRLVKLHERARTPSHQTVKALFEAGNSVEEIAIERAVKVTTITRALITLHQAGELDLTQWIHDNLEPGEFSKGKSFFSAKPQAKLKDAYEKLGLDYNTLRLCRMYVNKLTSSQEELKVA